jgi:riboflavin transporter FmnP
MLMLGLATWTVVSCIGGPLSVFLNGASVMRFQIITSSIFGVACLATKILFTRHFGIAGVPWATIITYSLLTVLPYAIYVPLLLTKMSGEIFIADEDADVESIS